MSDPIADFMAITGCTEEGIAIEYLSMTDFITTDAVNLYIADRDAKGNTSGARQTGGGGVVDVEATEVLSTVRDDPTPPTTAATSNASPTQIATLSAPDPAFPPYPVMTDRPVDNPPRGIFDDMLGTADDRLRSMFSLPSFVLTGESLNRVARAAQQRDQWIVTAIIDEGFRSACISRDVWNCSSMAIAAGSVVCAQFNVTTADGAACAEAFRVEASDLPVMFLVDPHICHREMTITLRMKADSSYNGEAVVDDILTFVGTKGSPRQSHAAAQQSFEESFVDVDDDGDDEVFNTAVPTVSAPSPSTTAAAATLVPVSGPTPAPAPVDVDAWTLSADDTSGFKLRVRLPKLSLTLCLRPEMPVEALVRYLAYRVYAEDAGMYSAPPVVELRGGFPPRVMPVPEDAETTLSTWPGVRTGDALTVHIHL